MSLIVKYYKLKYLTLHNKKISSVLSQLKEYLMKPQVCMIVAANKEGVIGIENKLPWHVPEDLQFFKYTTMGFPVIMGRLTYESIGKPLPGRPNYVLTRRKESIGGVTLLNEPKVPSGHSRVFIIGGSEVYKAYEDKIDVIYLTVINAPVAGDAFLPFKIQNPTWVLQDATYKKSASGTGMCFQTWVRGTNKS